MASFSFSAILFLLLGLLPGKIGGAVTSLLVIAGLSFFMPSRHHAMDVRIEAEARALEMQHMQQDAAAEEKAGADD